MDNNIIEQLVEIENKAQKISNEAHEEQLKLQTRIDDAIKIMSSEIESKTASTVNEIKNFEFSNTNIQLKQINDLTQQLHVKMEDEYFNCREKWEDELFNNIIGW